MCHQAHSTFTNILNFFSFFLKLEPIYTIDARKGNIFVISVVVNKIKIANKNFLLNNCFFDHIDTLEHARTLSSPKIAERVYFNQHNQPAFLQIDPVQMSDTGEYRCRVDFKKARTVNTVIQLRVISMKPLLLDPTKRYL